MIIAKVKCREGLRYFDEESMGFMIKSGQIMDLHEKFLRSNEIKSAIIKGHLILVEGETRFVFKDDILTITPGDKGNYVVGDKEGIINKNIKPLKSNVKLKPIQKKVDVVKVEEEKPKEEEKSKEEEKPENTFKKLKDKYSLNYTLRKEEENKTKVFKSENLDNNKIIKKDPEDKMFDDYDKMMGERS